MIKAVFVLLCIGQLYACRKSYQAMVSYYLFAGAMAYFTLPVLSNFDTARFCGLLVIWQSYVRYKWVFRNFFDSYFMLYVFYVFAVMIFMSFFWPLEFFFGSPVHREFRIFVQMITWGINVTLAVIISWIFVTRERFEYFVRCGKFTALLYCLYGLYQYIAYKSNLPLTGIIRNNIVDRGIEEVALFRLGEDMIFRINSFAGEPKAFASFLVLLFVFIISQYLTREKRFDQNTVIVCILISLCYYMTYSTSAYFTMLGVVVLFLLCKDISEFRVVFVLSGIAAIFYFIWGDVLEEVIKVRLLDRIEGEQDLPVTVTMNYLLENPRFLIAGLGSGGVSFYLAEIIGGLARMKAFTPNIGIVYMLSEGGIIGLVLLIVPYVGVWWKLVTKQLHNEHFRVVAFIALCSVCLLLIRPVYYTLPFLYASFIALDRMHRFFQRHRMSG